MLSQRAWLPSSPVSKLVQHIKPVGTTELFTKLFFVAHECVVWKDWDATGRILIASALKDNSKRTRSVIATLDEIYKQNRLSEVHRDLGYILEWCLEHFLRIYGRRLLYQNEGSFSVVMQSRVIDATSGQVVAPGPGDEDRTLDVTAAYIDSSERVICAVGFESKYNLGTAMGDTRFHRQIQYLGHISEVVDSFQTFIAICTEVQIKTYATRYATLCRGKNIAEVPLFCISTLIEGG